MPTKSTFLLPLLACCASGALLATGCYRVEPQAAATDDPVEIWTASWRAPPQTEVIELVTVHSRGGKWWGTCMASTEKFGHRKWELRNIEATRYSLRFSTEGGGWVGDLEEALARNALSNFRSDPPASFSLVLHPDRREATLWRWDESSGSWSEECVMLRNDWVEYDPLEKYRTK